MSDEKPQRRPDLLDEARAELKQEAAAKARQARDTDLDRRAAARESRRLEPRNPTTRGGH